MQNNQSHQVLNTKCFPEYKNTFTEKCERLEQEIQSREEVPEEDDEIVIFRKITNAFGKLTTSASSITKGSTTGKKKTPFRKKLDEQDVFVEYEKKNVAEIDDIRQKVKNLEEQVKTLWGKVDGKTSADMTEKNGVKSPRLAEESTGKLKEIEKSSSQMIALLQAEVDCQEAVKECYSKSRQLEQKMLKDLFDLIVSLELK
uniref:Uncharacterized protein n=1 Tax=Phlebotomus papatasi TaxID=29031 RepID=A0A1B0DFW5_PHLPP